jgi:ATP-dependent protease ClpP protease subunit
MTTVFEFPVSGRVDESLVAQVGRLINQATQARVGAVLVVVNSPGGDGGAAIQIYAALRHFSKTVGPVIAHVPRHGAAASAASMVALAADYIVLDPSSKGFIVHPPSGNPARGLRVARDLLEALYCERTLLSATAVRSLLDSGEVEIENNNAVRDGWADEIGSPKRALRVARLCAECAPIWPRNLVSPRRAAMSTRQS